MLRAYKYRIYPTEEQREFFRKSFGCVRFYWNKALEIKLKVFNDNKGKSKEERKPIPQVLPSTLKKEYPFLKEIDSLALANAQLNLEKHSESFLETMLNSQNSRKRKAISHIQQTIKMEQLYLQKGILKSQN